MCVCSTWDGRDELANDSEEGLRTEEGALWLCTLLCTLKDLVTPENVWESLEGETLIVVPLVI